MTEPSIDLQKFCGGDQLRPWLGKPFRFGDYSYATNGHIVVRVPARDCDSAPEKAKAVDKLAARLVEIFEPASAVQYSAAPKVSLPPVEDATIEDCEDCDGRGKEHDCPDCECTCLSCNGSGKETVELRVSTTFAGDLFNLRYVRLVVALPSLEIAAGTSDSEKSEPLLFRFEGGDGALMPCRKRFLEHVEIEQRSAA